MLGGGRGRLCEVLVEWSVVLLGVRVEGDVCVGELEELCVGVECWFWI